MDLYHKHPQQYHPYIPYPMEDNARKRQRRQTAGAFMQSLFGRPTSKPRPALLVPPRAFGPVRDLNPNDVLCGRGGRINSHAGNVQFRELVQLRKKDYLAKSTKKLDKAHIAADIVFHIRRMHPAGRFLKEDQDGSWYEIGDQKAIKKVGQALREDASGARGSKKEEGDKKSTEKKNPKPKKKQPSKSASEPRKPATGTPPPPSSSTAATLGQHRTVTVSGRGAKRITTTVRPRPSSEPYTPMVYQEIAPPPNYRGVSADSPSMLRPPGQSYSSTANFRSTSTHSSGGSVSGAAAAVMQEYQGDVHVPEEAFGRPFHPATHGESSNSGGSSGGAAKRPPYGLPKHIVRDTKESSLVSGVSSITDFSTTVSPTNNLHQLQQLRQHWASTQQRHPSLPFSSEHITSSPPRPMPIDPVGTAFVTPDAAAANMIPNPPDSSSSGFLARSLSVQAQRKGDEHREHNPAPPFASLDRSLSLPEHSYPSLLGDEPEREPLPMPVSLRKPAARGRTYSGQQHVGQLYNGGGGGGGGAPYHPFGSAMEASSVNSASAQSNSNSESLPGSIMSDLSESLIALDLAEPSKWRDADHHGY